MILDVVKHLINISDAQVLAAEINIPAFLQLFVIEQK